MTRDKIIEECNQSSDFSHSKTPWILRLIGFKPVRTMTYKYSMFGVFGETYYHDFTDMLDTTK